MSNRSYCDRVNECLGKTIFNILLKLYRKARKDDDDDNDSTAMHADPISDQRLSMSGGI